MALAPSVVAAVTSYLGALTDPAALDFSYVIPARVPSGLPVPR